MKAFEAKPVHLNWGIGMVGVYGMISLLIHFLIDDPRLRMTMWSGFGAGLFVTWFIIYSMHRKMVYEVGEEGLRYMRRGKMIWEIPRNQISNVRISGNRIFVAVKGLGHYTLTPMDGARDIYHLLSH
jgi:hypothetical protein